MGKRVKGKYKSLFAGQLIEHMRQGYSVESFCSVINITKPTLIAWTKKHEDFKDAYDLAMSYSAHFWENKLIDLANSGHFGAVKLALEKLHKKQWGENKIIEIRPANAGPIEYDTGVPQLDENADIEIIEPIKED